MPNAYGTFSVLWQEWERKLTPLVNGRDARLIFPPLDGPRTLDDGKVIFEVGSPILIANAPQKSASTRGGRHAIFIMGAFVFDRVDASVRPKLVHASASVTIYNVIRRMTDAATAELFEAVHFDMENAESQTAFHPIFHAQRGADNRLAPDVLRPALARALRLRDECVEIKQSTVPGTPYLRLPTPQLDLFSVLTMLIADFFCHMPQGGGTSPSVNPNTLTAFKAVLELLKDGRNIARDGVCTEALDERRKSTGDFASSAHWYAESK